ncbi:glycosyltransferase family 4 protein [Candidatus Roizmanbacteria bacterium]|nr:glycosyltransferase family 4 protein [Candidatus Roizmanbacteria bacterium]
MSNFKLKNKAFKIAFEISPLMTASGTFGDKSGVYRYTYGLISSLSSFLKKKDKNATIFLFTFNYDLLKQPLNPELYSLLKNKNVIYLNKLPNINQENMIYNDLFDFPPLRIILKLADKIFNIKSFYKQIINRFRFNNYLKILDKEFKKNSIKTIVHSETSFYPLNNYRNIITIYDLTAFIVPEFHRNETIDLQTRKLKFARKYCQDIICISQSTKRDLLKYSPEFKNKNIIIAYPGIDDSFKSNKETKKSTLIQTTNIVSNRRITLIPNKYLLYYGTFEPRKNLSYLVKGFLELLETKKIPENYKLLMIGGKGWGNIRNRIIEYLRENYPNDEKSPIIIVNYINDKYLKKIIKNAYALVYPSFYEGFGLPVLESMYLGTPVITSANSSLTEVGGSAPLYVDPNNFLDIKNKISYLIKNKTIASTMAKDGIVQSQKFSWEKTAKKLYDFI